MQRLWVGLLLGVIFAGCSGDPTQHASPNTNFQPTETIIRAGLLEGAYLNAGQNRPTALILPGSGPTDRNGNNPGGITAATYQHLARQLGARGVSTVRVDKRGMFGSVEAGNPNAVSIGIYAKDYRNWIDRIKTETGLDCIYLIGHSEGALMVSAAAIGRDDVCGLILISGAGRPFGDILREQLADSPTYAPILDQAMKVIDQLEAGERVDLAGMHPALNTLFHSNVQDYLISVMAVDPADVAARAKKRTLIIHGMTDLQIPANDAKKLAEATGGELVIIDDVNHILKSAPMDRTANTATYSNPDLPVSETVVSTILAFIGNE